MTRAAVMRTIRFVLAVVAAYGLVWMATWSVRLGATYGAPIPVGQNSGALLGTARDTYSESVFWADVAITAVLFLVLSRWGLVACLAGAAFGLGVVFGMLVLATWQVTLPFVGFPVPLSNALPGGPSLAIWLDALVWSAVAIGLARWRRGQRV